MSVQIGGAVSNTAADVDAASRAVRVTIRGNDPGALGSYRKSMTSGTIGAGLTAASEVFNFRWAPTPNTAICVLRRIGVSVGSVTGFAAGFVAINAFFARAFTVQGTTGGTAGAFTGNNAKKRTSFATSAGALMAITTTAALSGDTSTLDTDPFATISNSVIVTGGAPPVVNVQELYRSLSDYPIVFANSEGFILKATVPATGTWQLGVDVDWDEYASF